MLNTRVNFTKDTLDVIDMGATLSKHYAYERLGKDKYASFANTEIEGKVASYSQKSDVFNKALFAEAKAMVGLDGSMSNEMAITFPHFQRALFAIVEQILPRVYSKSDVSEILTFADVRSGADGDSNLFTIPSKFLLKINKSARGVRDTDYQRLHNANVVLTPEPRKGGVKLNIYEMAVGSYDFGEFINRVGMSFINKMNTEVVTTIYDSVSALATNFKEASYDEASFQTLADRVSAANSAEAIAFGSRIALRNLEPTNDYYKMGQGAERDAMGYLSTVVGVRAMALQQSVDPNDSYDFVIPNNKVLLISPATDKLVKIFLEGGTKIIQSREGDDADNEISYMMEQAWDIAIATSSHYGIVTLS